MENQKIQNDVEIILETWSASFSDNGWIWEQANKILKTKSKTWSEEYKQKVFQMARDQWNKPKDN